MKTSARLFFSHDAHTTASPLEQSERIKIIDALRGIALLGILMMNIPYFGMPYLEVFDLRLRNEFSGANYYAWWTVNGLFEGTMRALFSMLFGAGCILIIRKLEQRQVGLYAADIYYRRLIWLILFGLFNAFILNWPGDILFNYGLCGLFIFPFRNMKTKGLLIMGIVMLVVSTILATAPMYLAKMTRQKGEAALALEAKNNKLTQKQESDKAAWTALQGRMNVDGLRKRAAEVNAQMNGNYVSVMGATAPFTVKFETIKLYKSHFWDAIAFMFFGMYLFRKKVLTAERGKRFFVGLMLIGYAVGLSMNYFTLRTILNLNYDFTRLADEIYVNPYQVRRLFLAMGHLSLIVLLFKLKIIPWLFKAMARVGQMAFSNYLMQTIICSLVFYGYGMSLFGDLQRYQLYIVMSGVWLFQVAFSNLWLQYFRFGPFEWLWRSLTYWKRQPMKKRKANEGVQLEPAPVSVTI